MELSENDEITVKDEIILNQENSIRLLNQLKKEMKRAADNLDFENPTQS